VRRALAAAAPSRALVLAALGLTLAAGCTSRPAPPDPAVRAQALIEAGNQAYRAGDYGLAARRYAAAAVVKNDDPAAFYGMGMALSKLGRDEDARVAYARARALSHKVR
jgi:Flp pilus assembly protein TadD